MQSLLALQGFQTLGGFDGKSATSQNIVQFFSTDFLVLRKPALRIEQLFELSRFFIGKRVRKPDPPA